VKIDSAESFHLAEHDDICGHFHIDHRQMMQGLLEDPGLELFVTCTSSTFEQTRSSLKGSMVTQCTLDVVVYGIFSLYEEIGSWFEAYDIFLQDPRVCHQDTKYLNPHRLSSDGEGRCLMVSEVVTKASTMVQLSEIRPRPDLLRTFDVTQDLEEAPQPARVKTNLKRYVRSS
jgi:hypothetical protein